MLPRDSSLVNRAAIERLRSDQVCEQRTLEYKSNLPDLKGDARLDLLHDICSFLNSMGGDMIFGFTEARDRGKKLGYPALGDEHGIDLNPTDAWASQLEHIIVSNIEPRPPMPRFVKVENVGKGGGTFVMRIPRSWSAPHKAKDHSPIYGRSEKGKQLLDIYQIRDMSRGYDQVRDRMVGFRDYRRKVISSSNTSPVPNLRHTKMILHFMPVQSMHDDGGLDWQSLYTNHRMINAIAGETLRRISNVDGMLAFAKEISAQGNSYAQIFRSGIIEVVDSQMFYEANPSKSSLPLPDLEEVCVRALYEADQFYKAVGIDFPFAVSLVIENSAQFESDPLKSLGFQSVPQSEIVCPIIEVDRPSLDLNDYAKAMKPLFDVAAQALGFPAGSKNFLPSGDWNLTI